MLNFLAFYLWIVRFTSVFSVLWAVGTDCGCRADAGSGCESWGGVEWGPQPAQGIRTFLATGIPALSTPMPCLAGLPDTGYMGHMGHMGYTGYTGYMELQSYSHQSKQPSSHFTMLVFP